jgi:hypothetical protein
MDPHGVLILRKKKLRVNDTEFFVYKETVTMF